MPKKWRDMVGRPEIQKFFGALHGQRATKGVFITTTSGCMLRTRAHIGVTAHSRVCSAPTIRLCSSTSG
jgi:restriction endonuclease Mrr